ncbi:MAG: NAD-dependent epimerase/dehydratase family protein [Lachnospiraceae bacterium]|nr:NAD-dependent epimerase/dehydratase family protein [Lachnospiraceae bacterium]
MKKAILTGATGFVGKWLIKILLEADVDVTVIVRDKNKLDMNFVDKIHIYECEYYNYDTLEISASKYDVFYHLAWDGVASKDKDKLDIQKRNIDMSVNALLLAKRLECKKMIAAGTVAEYAYCERIMDFSQKQTPNDIYGAMKVSVYNILNVLSRKIGVNFIWTVLPSTFGEGRNNDNIITYTITKLLKNEKPLYGDLEQLWDFLYVREVARALWLIGDRGNGDKIYGIGSGQYRQLKDYIFTIRDIINPDMELGIGELPQMSHKAYSSCVGIYDLMKDTNFQVEIGFEQGIRNTIMYYKNEIR